jgi:hypothetical protein
MLLGYNSDGDIKFIFTDESYLNNKYPNNSAKINNFWKISNHGLKEFFISIKDFNDYNNYPLYKIINNELIRK